MGNSLGEGVVNPGGLKIGNRKSALRQSGVRVTERRNPAATALDTRSTKAILQIINHEDRGVAVAVRKTLPQIARAVDLAVDAIRAGGRMVYLGAGTSGRLGVLDASECLPTFGCESVIGVLAGAPAALTRSLEGVEDSPRRAARDLKKIRFSSSDLLVGISASGAAAYVIGGMRWARKMGAKVVGLTCNPAAPLKPFANVCIIPVVGPEVVAGSSRMKAGTAQKLVLNMLSTATMVRLGRVLSNRMINVQMTNQKLWKRGARILSELTGRSKSEATKILKASGRKLPVAILMATKRIPRVEAERVIRQSPNVAQVLREAMGEVNS